MCSNIKKKKANRFYGCINLRVVFQSAHCIKSFFPIRIGSTVLKCKKLCTRLVVGPARIFTLENKKQLIFKESLASTKTVLKPEYLILSFNKMGINKNDLKTAFEIEIVLKES